MSQRFGSSSVRKCKHQIKIKEGFVLLITERIRISDSDRKMNEGNDAAEQVRQTEKVNELNEQISGSFSCR